VAAEAAASAAAKILLPPPSRPCVKGTGEDSDDDDEKSGMVERLSVRGNEGWKGDVAPEAMGDSAAVPVSGKSPLDPSALSEAEGDTAAAAATSACAVASEAP
jgi:hypothetical protein